MRKPFASRVARIMRKRVPLPKRYVCWICGQAFDGPRTSKRRDCCPKCRLPKALARDRWEGGKR